MSVCDQLGVNNDYIRVNQVIQDYISRSKFGTTSEYDTILSEHIKKFIEEYTDDNRDISDYFSRSKKQSRLERTLIIEY